MASLEEDSQMVTLAYAWFVEVIGQASWIIVEQ